MDELSPDRPFDPRITSADFDSPEKFLKNLSQKKKKKTFIAVESKKNVRCLPNNYKQHSPKHNTNTPALAKYNISHVHARLPSSEFETLVHRRGGGGGGAGKKFIRNCAKAAARIHKFVTQREEPSAPAGEI